MIPYSDYLKLKKLADDWGEIGELSWIQPESQKQAKIFKELSQELDKTLNEIGIEKSSNIMGGK